MRKEARDSESVLRLTPLEALLRFSVKAPTKYQRIIMALGHFTRANTPGALFPLRNNIVPSSSRGQGDTPQRTVYVSPMDSVCAYRHACTSTAVALVPKTGWSNSQSLSPERFRRVAQYCSVTVRNSWPLTAANVQPRGWLSARTRSI